MLPRSPSSEANSAYKDSALLVAGLSTEVEATLGAEEEDEKDSNPVQWKIEAV